MGAGGVVAIHVQILATTTASLDCLLSCSLASGIVTSSGPVQSAADMATERVYFEQGIDGLFRKGIGERMTPGLREKLRAAGLDLSKPLQVAYPAPQVNRWMDLCARELFPALTLEQATYKLGELTIDGFQKNAMGKTLFAFLKVIGLRRSLPRMTQNFRTANNFMTVDCREVERDRFVLTFSEVDGYPWYIKGLADRGGHYSGALRLSSDRIVTDGHTLTIFWDIRPESNEAEFPGPTPERWIAQR